MKPVVYVVPFFAIGRYTTLDVSLRFRACGECRDMKLIEYQGDWAASSLEEFPEKMGAWATLIAAALKDAAQMGYHLAGSPRTMQQLENDFKLIAASVEHGHSDRLAAVGSFLDALASCNPSITS